MIYLERKVDHFLRSWKEDEDRKPLIIKGPRQVGKTESILRFGKENYKNIIYINFVEEPKYKMILVDGYKTDELIKNISLIDPAKKFIPGETLIFLDELQEFPEISTALKFFKIDGRFDVICSGSMLGINYRKIESNSVGYKKDYEMYSLDFEEFLWAKGYSKETRNDFLEHMRSLKPFNELEMSVYLSLFIEFCILGGMPAVIREYIEKGTFEGSLDTQRQLLADYREDIRKVASGARFKDYRGCIEWLNDAGIINVCYCLSFPELPLKGNYDEEKYKIYLADTGLLVAMLDEEVQEDLRVNRNLGVYKGALYENVVGEALVKAGYDLYYFKKENSTLEEDFFVRTAEALVPVEVKASNNRSKSLRTLIDSEHYPDIHFGIKLAGTNIGYGNGVYTFPYFCSFLLKEYLRGFQHLENKS